MVDNVTSRRVVPGDWYAVATGRLVVAVPPSARDRVAGLWDLAEGGAGFDALLDALVSGGLAALPSLALVEHAEVTRVLVRGEAGADLRTDAGTTRVRAVPGTVWAEELVPGVLGGTLLLSGTADGSAQPLVGELARVARVEFGEAVGPDDADEERDEALAPLVARDDETTDQHDAPDAGAEDVEETPTSVAAADDLEPRADEPGPAAVDEPGPSTEESVPFPQPPADDPLGGPLVPPSVPAPEPLVDQPGPGYAAPAFGVPPVPGPPGVFGVPAYDPALPGGDVEDTIIGGPAVGFERPAPVGAEQAPAVLARPVAALVVSTGDLVNVDRAILVGRAPEARRFASEDKPALLAVPSPQQEISSTHLEIRPGAGVDHGMAVVTDLGSTNGTVLVQPGLPPEELQAGIAVALIPGAILDLGDGVTIQVTNP